MGDGREDEYRLRSGRFYRPLEVLEHRNFVWS
jgi:hypothetical protein